MRVALLLFISILTGSSFGQSDLVINELQAANRHTYVAPDGSTPDWIEVYNAGTSPIDLHGMRFAVVGRQHVMEPLVVAPGEHRLLWFDGRPARGADPWASRFRAKEAHCCSLLPMVSRSRMYSPIRHGG
ncbi:MAG: lamin tail domain-containing protein [Flavobacteriales bacterium]|nr:lamin tail domain-containing protein [Flavobacteriales bacterium]